MKPTLKTIADQPSWVLRSDQVELAVTALGGHMAPVTFYRHAARSVQPYYINPWHAERRTIDVPVLAPLRGDFFCMPFGGDNAYRGENHPAHGEPATARWRLGGACRCGDVASLTLTMRTTVRPGRVTKRLSLVDGHNVVYVQHLLEGYTGRMPAGHHATLAVPEREGSVRVATGPVRFGLTNPSLFSDPAVGEYQSLAINKRFGDLSKVPLLWAEPRYGDCSALPARMGFTDLLAVFAKPGVSPAWTTAAVEDGGYMWFSLKDPVVLPTTVLWISNRGRHGPPWCGRNRCLGLEEVCAYFADGLGASVRANPLTRAGIPTALKLSRTRPTAVNYIEGVVKIPRGFGRVATARFAPGRVTFLSETGRKATAAVRHEFLTSGEL